MTVSELTRILDQSQPRVSRHLKLMCDAGLLERFKEGIWAFYRLADERAGIGGALARELVAMADYDDPMFERDRAVLHAIKRARADAAASYFRSNAANWDKVRALHVDEGEVEAALLDALPPGSVRDLLDIGTGTGRILELFGASVARGIGIDLSREMLAVARSNLDDAGLRNCRVRHGDMYELPLEDGCFDAVTVHLVLHYADDPGRTIAEAARVTRPEGHVVIVDFAPHGLDQLREDHAHRRLGFSDEEVEEWCGAAGLAPDTVIRLPGEPLTVNLWKLSKLPGREIALDYREEIGAL